MRPTAPGRRGRRGLLPCGVSRSGTPRMGRSDPTGGTAMVRRSWLFSLVLGTAATAAALVGASSDVRAAELLHLSVYSQQGGVATLEIVAGPDQAGPCQIQM